MQNPGKIIKKTWIPTFVGMTDLIMIASAAMIIIPLCPPLVKGEKKGDLLPWR
jgi:hypothetical protein